MEIKGSKSNNNKNDDGIFEDNNTISYVMPLNNQSF